MTAASSRRQGPTGLPAVALVAGLALAAATALLHPVAGLALLILAGLAVSVMRWPESATVAYVFLIALVPTYFRVPGAAFIHPLSFLLAPLLALAALRIAIRPRELAWSPLHTLALVFLLAVFVTSIHAQFDGTTAREIYYQALVPIAGFAVVFQSLRREDQIGRYLDALLAGAAVSSIFGLIEYALGHNWLLEKFLIDVAPAGVQFFYFSKDELPELGLFRISATFINAIEFATFIGMMIPFAVLGAIHHRALWRRLAYGASAALFTLALVLTFSRGALLAVLAGGAILYVREPKFRRLVIPIAAAAALAAAIEYPYYAEQIAARVGDTDTVSTRWGLYRLATWMFLDNPVLGIGYGNFKHFILEYAQQHGAQEFVFPPEWFTLCENTYLQLLSEMGVVGLASHLAILAAFALLCLRGAAQAGDRSWHATAIGLGGLIYMINGFGSGSVILYFQATQAFWVLLALAAYCGRAGAAQEPVKPGSNGNVGGFRAHGGPGAR